MSGARKALKVMSILTIIMAAITAAVSVVTHGKGKVSKVEKL